MLSKTFITNTFIWSALALGLVVKAPEKELQNPYSETAYFASGCFWCVEAIFESVAGVGDVVSGYAGGTEKDPTYNQVAGGRTTHAEAVMVPYNPAVVSYETLVKVFFRSHDPTTLNRQGPDRGTQYRSIAFYKTTSEKAAIEAHIAALNKKNTFKSPIITQVSPFTTFYKAEEYHQDFEARNPNNPYVRAVSIPRLLKFKAAFPALLKSAH